MKQIYLKLGHITLKKGQLLIKRQAIITERLPILASCAYLAAVFMKYICFLLFICLSPCLARAQADTVVATKYVTLSQINIVGNKRTKKEILLREMNLQEGQMVLADSMASLLEQSRQRLITIGLFTEIKLADELTNDTTLVWNITVKERWYIIPEPTFQLADRNFNVWWTEQNRDLRRTIIGVTLRDKNFRGNLENIALTAQIGYTQKLYLEYIKPYIDKNKKHGFGIGFGFAESEETFYKTDSNKLQFIKTKGKYIYSQAEVTAAYIYRPAYAARHIFSLGYKAFRVADTVIKSNADYYKNGSNTLKMLELTYRYELNKVDNLNYPLQGTKIVGQLVGRYGIEGLNYQVFGTLELGHYRKLWPKWFLSTTFRGRLSAPGNQPYTFRNAMGTKYEYIRGYEYYVIDGSHYGLLRANIKRELLNINIRNIPIRYLPNIPLRIYPKLFADAGYVHNNYAGNSFLNNKMLYSAGVGVDIYTAYDIKIRIEYAWNHLGQKGLFLHFNSE